MTAPPSTRARHRVLRRCVLAATLGSLATGCVTTVHPSSTAMAELEGATALEVHEGPTEVHRFAERRLAHYTRRVRPAYNIDVVATLWDPAIIAVDPVAHGAPTTAGLREDPADADARLARWHERYVRSRTSFTVVLELANRPGPDPRRVRHGADEGEFVDPLVQPRSWSFVLERGDGTEVGPSEIEVQAIDRFPTRAGGYHYRLAFAVHFPGELSDAFTGEHREGMRIKLRVRPLIDDRGASGLGPSATARGFVVGWFVSPPDE